MTDRDLFQAKQVISMIETILTEYPNHSQFDSLLELKRYLTEDLQVRSYSTTKGI